MDEAYTSSHHYLRYVFDSFDLNRDGRIQREEFTRILRACTSDFRCNQELVEALIS
jgi:Ca2+-binding EF-hand superfamily protein